MSAEVIPQSPYFAGTLLGLILGMLLYNLFLYLSLRDRRHLNFSLAIVLPQGLFQLIITGQARIHLWPGATTWDRTALAGGSALLAVGLLAFTMGSLQLAKRFPGTYKRVQLLAAISLGWAVLTPWVPAPYDARLALALLVVASLVGIGAAWASWARGDKAARFFIIAAATQLLAALLAMAQQLGWQAPGPINGSLLPLAGAVVVMLLSLSLADRFADARRSEAGVRLRLLEQERLARRTRDEMINNLKAMDEQKDQFLAKTSLELRSPMQRIVGLADSLLAGAGGKLPPRAHNSLSMILRSGQRLNALVNDIGDIARLNHGQVELEVQAVALQDEVEAVLALSRVKADEHQLELRNLVPADLSAVRADEGRLQQILVNLIGNAIKFTARGSVTIEAREEESWVQVSISDTGAGIEAEQLERIFGAFEQAVGAIDRSDEGTGLGLAITRKLVEAHGGDIEVESQPGEGSCFRFTLPATREKPAAARPLASQLVADLEEASSELCPLEFLASSSQQHGEWRVLLADCNAVTLAQVRNDMAAHGIAVSTATSGPQVLELLESDESYDLVLMEVMLPGMSGYEVCERIRREHPANELPVVLITDQHHGRDKVTGFDAGANDFLPKPFSRSELLARIRTHVEMARTHRAYSRFVPREFLRLLGKERIEDVVRGDQVQRHMAVLFADIRGFTTLSESMSPRENFNFINSFLGRMGPIIRESGGFIDKYLGDGLMAIFPEGSDALRAAVGMNRELHRYNRHRANCEYRSIDIGVGIHHGSLMLGTVGEQKRLDGTVISSTVNLAARLEGLTKLFQVPVIASEDILAGLTSEKTSSWRCLGRVMLKGKRRAVRVYDVFDGEEAPVRAAKLATLADFEEGVTLFSEGDMARAERAFAAVCEQDPHDAAARFYREHCAHFKRVGTPPGWDGILSMQRVMPATALIDASARFSSRQAG